MLFVEAFEYAEGFFNAESSSESKAGTLSRLHINFYLQPLNFTNLHYKPRHPTHHRRKQNLNSQLVPLVLLFQNPGPLYSSLHNSKEEKMASPQREAYQLPSQRDAASSQPQQQQPQSATGYTPSYGALDQQQQQQQLAVTYICGECASKVALTMGDAIRCKECGHRVLYKERTRR
jgi:DNA-directed RNA polymerases I, II, and III subunit RPABC4